MAIVCEPVYNTTEKGQGNNCKLLQRCKVTSEQDLKDIGLTGHLPTFIKKILNNRTFRVTLGDVTSDCFNQEAGVPQGSVLSTRPYIIWCKNKPNK